jgi:NADH dehydrogenase FAD-containing subunit
VVYDALIVATGARAADGPPWKAYRSYEQTSASLYEIQEMIKNANSVVVGGGGPTRVETAGELGYEYGRKKEITLICFVQTFMCSRCEEDTY